MASLRSPVALSSQYPPTELEKARAEVQRARADMAAAQDQADQAKAKLHQATRDAKAVSYTHLDVYKRQASAR